jgi:3-methylcrotonyl-CoA carboxylase alpha subunit
MGSGPGKKLCAQTLEVMKMEQSLRAPFAGVLKEIKCKVGDIVGEGVELAVVEPASA